MSGEEALPIEGTRLLLEFRDAAGRLWRGAAFATPVETAGHAPRRLEDMQGMQMQLMSFKVVTSGELREACRLNGPHEEVLR